LSTYTSNVDSGAEAGVTGPWSKALAVSAALLGLGYFVAGLLGRLFGDAPNAVRLILVGVGVFLAAVAAGVWRGRGWAKAAATVTGFAGTLLFGTLLFGFDRDPDATKIANDVSAATLFGLAGLSALVLAMGVTLAVVETKLGRNEPANTA
jgi:hypothetical protein